MFLFFIFFLINTEILDLKVNEIGYNRGDLKLVSATNYRNDKAYLINETISDGTQLKVNTFILLVDKNIKKTDIISRSSAYCSLKLEHPIYDANISFDNNSVYCDKNKIADNMLTFKLNSNLTYFELENLNKNTSSNSQIVLLSSSMQNNFVYRPISIDGYYKINDGVIYLPSIYNQMLRSNIFYLNFNKYTDDGFYLANINSSKKKLNCIYDLNDIKNVDIFDFCNQGIKKLVAKE